MRRRWCECPGVTIQYNTMMREELGSWGGVQWIWGRYAVVGGGGWFSGLVQLSARRALARCPRCSECTMITARAVEALVAEALGTSLELCSARISPSNQRLTSPSMFRMTQPAR